MLATTLSCHTRTKVDEALVCLNCFSSGFLSYTEVCLFFAHNFFYVFVILFLSTLEKVLPGGPVHSIVVAAFSIVYFIEKVVGQAYLRPLSTIFQVWHLSLVLCTSPVLLLIALPILSVCFLWLYGGSYLEL